MILWTVLLAAGASRRLGTPKQLVVVDQQTLLERSIRIALATTDHCLVVLGCQADRLAGITDRLAATRVVNQQWEAGMGSSIACGISALPDTVDGVLILPCDLARLKVGELQELVSNWRDQPQRAAAASYAGITGVPVIFPRPAFASLAGLSGDHGAAGLLQQYQPVAVKMASAATDVDRPQDLAKL
jgi:CTP:molybdopterin cytidylyltransferase MocA